MPLPDAQLNVLDSRCPGAPHAGSSNDRSSAGPLTDPHDAQLRAGLRRWLGISVSAALSLALASCQRAGDSTATPNDREIDLTSAATSPPLPPPQPTALRPCKKDDTSCSAATNDTAEAPAELDPSKRYTVTVGQNDPRNGSERAPVTLVVFSDFQCPFCRKLSHTLAEVRFEYEDQVSLVWKDLPLPMHEFARPAALLAREAFAKRGDRGFWQVHDALFAAQPEFSDERLARLAQRFELSWPALERYQGAIGESFAQVEALNIRSTPTTFVNGRPVIGAQPYSDFAMMIEQELTLAETQ